MNPQPINLDEKGKIIDVKETNNYIVVSIKGIFGIEVKVIPKPKKEVVKWKL